MSTLPGPGDIRAHQIGDSIYDVEVRRSRASTLNGPWVGELRNWLDSNLSQAEVSTTSPASNTYWVPFLRIDVRHMLVGRQKLDHMVNRFCEDHRTKQKSKGKKTRRFNPQRSPVGPPFARVYAPARTCGTIR